MERPDPEWELPEKILQEWYQVAFADASDSVHDHELRHLINRIDVIHSFYAIQVSLVNRVDADPTGLASEIGALVTSIRSSILTIFSVG